MQIDKKAILAAHTAARPLIELFVPQWNQTIYLMEPSAGRIDQLNAYQAKARAVNIATAYSAYRARVAMMVCVDETREPLFTQADEKALQNGSSPALDLIFKESRVWLGLDDAVEEEVKNSQETGEGDSSSVSE